MIKIKNKYNIFSNSLSHERYFKEFSFLPYPYREDDYNYELNEKETFALDITILAYLYEHLAMYKELANKKIDLNYHKFIIKNKFMTQKECIDRMINDIYIILSIFYNDNSAEEHKKQNEILMEKKNDLFDILKGCFWTLCW